MNYQETEKFIERNYKVTIESILDVQEPDGYRITGEILTFFDKINSVSNIYEGQFLELFTMILNNIKDCDLSIEDEFIQEQWIEIITKFLPSLKKEALRELVFYSSQDINYWKQLKTLEFSFSNLDKNEKINETIARNIHNIITKDWKERKENWKRYTKEFIELLKRNNIEIEGINIAQLDSLLESNSANN